MLLKSLLLSTLSAAALIAGAAQADVVKLRAADGSIDLEGTFVEFADSHYVVDTPLGVLRVAEARVDCIGAICPSFDAESADIRVMVSNRAERDLTLDLFAAYADNLGTSLRIFDTPGHKATFADIQTNDGTMIRLAVVPASDSRSLAALQNGTGDITFASLPAQTGDQSSSLLGIEGLAAVVHPQNPVSEVSIDQLRAVLSGRITNWAELGGEDRPIRLARFGEEQTLLPRGGVSEDTAQRVASDRGALGFVPVNGIGSARRVQLIDSCGADAGPDRLQIKTGRYPFARKLYMQYSVELAGQAALDFVAFALSDDARPVVTAANLLEPGIEAMTMELTSPRAQMLAEVDRPRKKVAAARDMLAKMVDHERLTTTFRFSTGSAEIPRLDEDEVVALADHLATLPAGSRVLFVGFSDEVGTFQRNSRLSLTRAREVAAAVLKAGNDSLTDLEIDSVGFGELAPVACNSNETGRSQNRRVEIWIDTSKSEEIQTVLNQ